MPDIKVLIVDDDAFVREGFNTYFHYAEGISVVGVASNGEQALDVLAKHEVDVVVSDIHMPVMGGEALLQEVQALDPSPAFVAITGLDTDEVMLRMISGGAAGYVLKAAEPATIIQAVKDAYRGGTTVSPAALKRLVNYFPAIAPDTRGIRRKIAELPEDERDLLDLLCEGKSNAEIADTTHYSLSGVKKKVSKLIDRFGAESRFDLVVLLLKAYRPH